MRIWSNRQGKPSVISKLALALAIFFMFVAVLLFTAANSENSNAVVGVFFIIVGVLLTLPYISCRKKVSSQKPQNDTKPQYSNTRAFENSLPKFKEMLTAPPPQPKALAFDNILSQIPIVQIDLNHRFLKTNYVKEMPYVSFSIPTENGNYGNFVVIDTETTGISITNEIIELSAIKYINYKPVAAFTTLIKPKESIPQEVVDLTHITNDMVLDSPTIYQVMPAFIEFVGDFDIVGHNLLFDLKFVYKYGFKFHNDNRRYFDTLEIARKNVRGTQDFKLTTLCSYYGIIRNDAHRSLSDCLATAMVYMRILNNN